MRDMHQLHIVNFAQTVNRVSSVHSSSAYYLKLFLMSFVSNEAYLRRNTMLLLASSLNAYSVRPLTILPITSMLAEMAS